MWPWVPKNICLLACSLFLFFSHLNSGFSSCSWFTQWSGICEFPLNKEPLIIPPFRASVGFLYLHCPLSGTFPFSLLCFSYHWTVAWPVATLPRHCSNFKTLKFLLLPETRLFCFIFLIRGAFYFPWNKQHLTFLEHNTLALSSLESSVGREPLLLFLLHHLLSLHFQH